MVTRLKMFVIAALLAAGLPAAAMAAYSCAARIRALSRRLRADQGAAVFEPCVGRCVW
jgi:hypothetical protein